MSDPDRNTRSFEMKIDIAASPAAVWKALADAEALSEAGSARCR